MPDFANTSLSHLQSVSGLAGHGNDLGVHSQEHYYLAVDGYDLGAWIIIRSQDMNMTLAYIARDISTRQDMILECIIIELLPRRRLN